MVMVRIVEATPLGARRLHLRFADGTEGEVDVAEVIAFEGVFRPLEQQAFFEQVYVDPAWGTVCWPGDLDLAPEPLYERLTRKPGASPAR